VAVEAVSRLQLPDDVSVNQSTFHNRSPHYSLARYAKNRGTFYVQLEDDVLTKKGFVSIMKHFALEKIADKQTWLEFIRTVCF
jgi:hypothetical protein